MADVKISQLADAGALTGTELLELVQSGQNKKVTAETLVALLLASPAFTGNPTAPTQEAGNNSTRLATTAFVMAAVAAIVDSSPGTLDTLNELAAALGDDPNFATTIASTLAGKQPLDATLTALAGLTVAANKGLYATGADAFATFDFSSYMRGLMGSADQPALVAALGVAGLQRRVDEFTSTMTIGAHPNGGKPSGAVLAVLHGLGGGGGGQGGQRDDSTYADVDGGEGGYGGSYERVILPASLVSNSDTVTVGAAGEGGAGATANYADGAAGTNGGNTSIGSLLLAAGGAGGGVEDFPEWNQDWSYYGGNPGDGGAWNDGVLWNDAQRIGWPAGAGGGGGGGFLAETTTPIQGGDGGGFLGSYDDQYQGTTSVAGYGPVQAGPSGGSGAGGNGAAKTTGHIGGGTGGAGGAARHTSGKAYNGGNGGPGGGGGGGGGHSMTNSGAGGDGGDGGAGRAWIEWIW